MKVALVHDWLTGMRGGERCLEGLCELFPDAPIYTLVHVKGSVSETIEGHEISPSFLNAIPNVGKLYRYCLPLFPSAIRSFTFDHFDLVLSSSHCVAKGIRVPEGTCHISYVHTPMRYIWDGHDQYFGAGGFPSFGKIGMTIFRKRLQRWDVQSNASVHGFIANSSNVAERIKHQYGREASVVHPPVNWHACEASEEDAGFFLMVTAFAPYKKVDLAIQVANQLHLHLKIVGQGQEERRLKQLAGPTVEFLGWISDERVRELYGQCRAVLFPGEEDFGIVPLEAMASGKPVIAYGKGGVLESVNPVNPTNGAFPPTGVFFYDQTVNGLCDAIQLFEQRRSEFEAQAIRAHVEAFDREHFKAHLKQVIMATYHQYRQSHLC